MKNEVVKVKLLQIFNFVKALNELKNPVQMDIRNQKWHMWLHDLPVHHCIKRLSNGRESFYEKENNKREEEYILRIERPILTEAHNSPEDIRTMKIFKELYRLYSQIQKESETVELILGEGLLSWEYSLMESIYHPVLLKKVELIFHSEIPAFTIRLAGAAPELYTALFRSIYGVNNTELSKCIEDMESSNYEPLDFKETDEFLKRLVIALSWEGEYKELGGESRINPIPQISRKSVLFLRKRNLGFSVAMDSIIEDITNNGEVTSFMKKIVGVDGNAEEKNEEIVSSSSTSDLSREEEELLFTKPVNEEQVLVAKRLEKNGAVLVQGPPGTGKTHTIANMVGHLLAQGKTVLITSHTEKALKVVRDKIVDSIKPLCFPFLSGTDSKLEMEKTLDAINEKRSSTNLPSLCHEIEQLEGKRKEIFSKLINKKEALKKQRQNEVKIIVCEGKEYSSIEAAKYVAKNKEEHSWIPAPVTLGVSLPLTVEEIKELYKSNERVTPLEEKECAIPHPAVEELLLPYEFKELVKEHSELQKLDLEYKKHLWQTPNQEKEGFWNMVEEMESVKKTLESEKSWQLKIIYDGCQNNKKCQQRIKLIEEIEEFYIQYMDFTETLIEFNPIIKGENNLEECKHTIKEIAEHLQENGAINRFKMLLKPKWKKVIEASKVNERAPKTKMDFKILEEYIEFQLLKDKIKKSWDRQINPIEGPSFAEMEDDFEESIKQYVVNIRFKLKWYKEKWKKIKEQLKCQEFDWECFIKESELEGVKYSEPETLKEGILKGLPQIIEAQQNRIEFNKINRKITNLYLTLDQYQDGEINNALQNTVVGMNGSEYEANYYKVKQLYKVKETVATRKKLMRRLQVYAPAWVEKIRNREGLFGENTVTEAIKKAWIWRQLNDELEARAELSMEALQKEIGLLEEALRKITIELVDKKAWRARIERITFEEIQAIESWKLTQRNMGKTNNKRKAALMEQSQRLIKASQSAIPVWIMPLNKVVENFNPKENKFDVVIIDEASQADILALTVLYMGKQIIIVGDEEQVSPVSVGINTEEVQNLIETYLSGIHNKEVFTGQFSIYDLAKVSGFQPVCLNEHFRCVAPIIQFSNDLSYNGKIKPLREESEFFSKSPLIPYNVKGSISSNKKINKEEAMAIASLLIACTEQEEYKCKTFGVISLVGEEQAVWIDDLLQKYMEPCEYINRKIQCGNAAQFQGDEREIVFLSLVDTQNKKGQLPLSGFGANDMMKKRYNVAASRARDQLWVVHSLNPEADLKEGDLRKKLIQYAENPNSMKKIVNRTENELESEFERFVFTRLNAAGYRVRQQWQVGSLIIDMVVEGQGKKVAIKCEGEKWHTAESLSKELNRQAVLERLGWKFIYIRGSSFFRDQDKEMEAVFNKIREFGIVAEGNVEQKKEKVESNELIERVTRRAEVIRQNWSEAQGAVSIQKENVKNINSNKTLLSVCL